jgi:4-hydroxy-2-oxoheptanedioate aldolase
VAVAPVAGNRLGTQAALTADAPFKIGISMPFTGDQAGADNPFDTRTLTDCLHYLLNRRQIVQSGSLAPSVAPLVRIPPNGRELNEWIAKQVLDAGVYGIIWPHVSTEEEAHNAVAACLYPRQLSTGGSGPLGKRGVAPLGAARYWGLTPSEYYARAEVWPISPDGEILVIIMCEDTLSIRNLPKILQNVPGIGVVLIGQGDLSHELGVPRQYDHPDVVGAVNEVLNICNKYGVACGHPHVDAQNVSDVLERGFRWLMTSPETSFAGLERGRQIVDR